MWAKKYCCCRECGTTERKHYGGGLCARCYNNAKYKNNPTPQRNRSNDYYTRNTEEAKARSRKRYYRMKGYIQSQNKEYRDDVYFDGLREKVLDRDNHKCAMCGDKAQVVHHIDCVNKKTGNPNNTMENLTSLCRGCHSIIHKPRLGTGRVKI